MQWCGIGHEELVWNGVVKDMKSWCGMVWYRTARVNKVTLGAGLQGSFQPKPAYKTGG